MDGLCALFCLCLPLAVLGLVLFPIGWVVSFPFRLFHRAPSTTADKL